MPATGARVLALDIGGTKLMAGIADADGHVTRQAVAPTLAAERAPAVLERALHLARRCCDAELTAGGDVAAVGVSTMGLTHDTHVELAPNVPGWDELRLPAALASAFPDRRVVIGNDVKVAAQAEMTWGALHGVDDGLYLNLGTGIAAAIITGGHLLGGAHGAAGEIGYTLFRGAPEPRMARDGAAPLEEWFGGAGVARRLAGGELPATVAGVVAAAGTDPSAAEFLDELWTGIAVAAANLCVVTDPRVIAVGGGYVRSASGLLDRVREVVERAVPYPPSVVAARFGADASLRGAAAAALEAMDMDFAQGDSSNAVTRRPTWRSS